MKPLPRSASRVHTPTVHRLFILDDHPVLRQGLVRLLEAEGDLTVCDEAASASEAFTKIQKSKPDLVVTDITLRGGSGLELIKNLRPVVPDIRVLVLSMHDDQVYAERALRAGAMGYVSKYSPPAHLLTAVREVLAGRIYVSEAVKDRIMNRMVGGRSAQEAAFPIDTLSDRELEVFRAIGNGLRTQEVARSLSLSVKTIETYREHLKAKLNLRNSSELTRHAIDWMRAESTT